MSEIKQRRIKNKKHLHRRTGRIRRPAPKWFSFPEDKYKALEEVRRILGLTKAQLRFFWSLLERSSSGELNFHAGNVRIQFSTWAYYEDEPLPSRIYMKIRIKEKQIEHHLKYKFEIPCSEK
jgi:hypothetical protein